MKGAGIPLEVAAEVQPLSAVLGDVWREAELGGSFRLAPSSGVHRITAFASTVTAGELLNGIASLLNLQWTDPAGKPVSGAAAGVRGGILLRPDAARRYDERLRRELLEIGASPLFHFAGFARRAAPQQWKQWKQGGLPPHIPAAPVLAKHNIAYLALEYSHAGLHLLSLLGPTQRRMLVERQSLVLEWGAMSQAQRDAAILSIGVPEEDERFRPLPVAEVEAMRQEARAWVMRHGVQLTVSRDPSSGLVTRSNSGGEFSEAMVRPGKRPQDHFTTRGHPYEGAKESKAKQLYAELERTPFPSGVLPENDASLRRVSWPWILARLAEKAPQLNLLSDAFTGTLSAPYFKYYNQKLPITARELSGVSLAEGLDRLCDAYKRVWWRDENGLLLFRSRKWFLEQDYEMPDVAVLRIVEELRRPSPDWLRLLDVFAGLTLQQLQGFAAATGYYEQLAPGPDGVRNRYHSEWQFEQATRAYNRFQVFRVLSPAQQAWALSREGFPVTAAGEKAMVGVIRAVQEISGGGAFQGNDLRLNILTSRYQVKPNDPAAQPPASLRGMEVWPPARQGRLRCSFEFHDRMTGPVWLLSLDVQALLAGRKEVRRSSRNAAI